MQKTKLQLNDHRLSVVIPVYNEEDNVAPLVKRMHTALNQYPQPWELIIVDDGSADRTPENLDAEKTLYGSHLRIVYLQRNYGQTAAMQAGIDAARGDVIVTLDGDLQNDPVDIPRLVKRLIEDDLDLVTGWRKNRKDDLILRKIPSRIANRLIARITGVKLHDYGCSLKAYKSSVIKSVRLYGEMHRFIPAWVAMNTRSARIKEEIVSHNPRELGESKYGITRTFRVLLDLLSVYFFMRYSARPGHFFGKLAFISGSLGGLILGYLFVLKIMGESIGGRPLLLVGVLFVLASLQLLTTGVLSELLARTYYESSGRRTYHLLNEDVLRMDMDSGWKNENSDKTSTSQSEPSSNEIKAKETFTN